MGSEEQQPQQSAAMRAITVSREYGSGGGEVARRLADRLGWQLLDHQIVESVAEKLDITGRQAQAHDEHVEGFVGRLLEGMQSTLPPPVFIGVNDTYEVIPPVDEKVYHETLRQVLIEAAKLGRVVIVGRGSQVIFGDERDILHARVVAPLKQRIAYVVQREGLDASVAQVRIQQKDNERRRALRDHYRRDEADTSLYDLVVNTGVLDLQAAVDLILLALECKAQRLDVPEGELGPVAGLPIYPAPPEESPL
ncbi:MAG: AAA family ATPase [Chloroflexia bacterium]